MQIVIDIPETFYEDCKRFAEYTEADMYIANGQILPKGHGRLVDVSKMESHEMYNGKEFVSVVFTDDIYDLPTIIEADKEGAEE